MCADLVEVRKKYFEERSLYSLFRNVNPETIFDNLIGMFCNRYFKLNFMWRSILTVIQKSCGFVEMYVCVCMFEIIVP